MCTHSGRNSHPQNFGIRWTDDARKWGDDAVAQSQ